MRKLQIIAILGITLLSYNTMTAQTKIESKEKATINSSEKTPEKIVFKEIEYYIIDGVWYAKINNKFVIRTAPKGAQLKELPKGGENVTLGGTKYYRLNGVFYKKVKNGMYQVSRP